MTISSSSDEKLKQVIDHKGFKSLEEVTPKDIDDLFEHYVRLYRQKKLSPIEVSYFCDCFFRVASFDQIYSTSKYAAQILGLCDLHVDARNSKMKKFANYSARNILDDIQLPAIQSHS